MTIVEFSDFQCPFCKRSEPTVKGVLDKYGKDVSLVWMNQPLPFHDHAMDAATAFQAAARQGGDKAWKLHDKMYENNTALTRADIEKYAGEVGLNTGKFKKDWDDPKIKAEVDAGFRRPATAAGANGTPTFFINGREVVGAQPADAFEKVIDDEIKKADELIKKGTPLKDVYKKRIEAAAAGRPRRRRRRAAPEGKQDVKLGDAPVKGPASAKVTVIAFSDFQCPFCSRAVPVMKQIEDEYKGKVKIAFKQLPLPFHDKAHLAAEAALAANEQGKFWQMHDKLFANQQALDRPSLEKYAEELGLNMAQVQGGARLGQVQGQGRRRRQGGRRGRRHRHADLLHQRHEGRRRSALRRLQDRHRHRAQRRKGSAGLARRRRAQTGSAPRERRGTSRGGKLARRGRAPPRTAAWARRGAGGGGSARPCPRSAGSRPSRPCPGRRRGAACRCRRRWATGPRTSPR